MKKEVDVEYDEEVKHAARNASIANVRHLTYVRRCKLTHTCGEKNGCLRTILECAPQDPIGCLLAWEKLHWEQLWTAKETWVPRLQHRLIIVFALLGKVIERKAVAADDVHKWYLHTIEEAWVILTRLNVDSNGLMRTVLELQRLKAIGRDGPFQ